ncbi:hypothetical protein EIP86_000797 [Pleurotus ostreatoroseus]|nr:hypothetical protein EIP86_000797 [Pleurotus ostreatoroseus]
MQAVDETEKTGASVPSALGSSEPTRPKWWSLVLHERKKRDSIHWLDGLVGCATDDNKYLITSPTTSYIPRPLYGKIDVSLHEDGHFGSADPIHHPQFIQHESRYPWMAAIDRCRTTRAILCDIWQPLKRTTDFELVKTSNVGLGVVPSAFKRYANDAVLPLGELVALFEETYGVIPELNWLFSTLLDAIDRLAFPATFRDMARTWAGVQRFSLYTCAWFDWNITFMQTYRAQSIVRAFDPLPYDRWMGCFTTSTLLASRMAKSNVPVWLMRPIENFSGDEIIEQAVVFSEPVSCLSFLQSVQYGENRSLFANQINSTRTAGDEHITWINRMAVRYLDENKFLLNEAQVSNSKQGIDTLHSDADSSVRNDSQQGLTPYSTRYSPYVVKRITPSNDIRLGKNERAKFDAFTHPLLPPSILQWQAACSSVDLSARAPAGQSVWKYMFPEARLVITSPTPRRQMRFICNWLRLRETWLFLISSTAYDSDTVHPLRIQEWREYLYTSSATQSTDNSATSNIALQKFAKRKKKSFENKRAVHDMFRNVFGQNIMDSPIPDTWFGRSLAAFHQDTSELADAETVHTVQLIGWELHEMEFRWEITQLEELLIPIDDDRLLERHERQLLVDAVFPTKCKIRMSDLPSRNSGLSAENPEERAPFVEALRVLLCRWPSVPSTVANSAPLTTLPLSQLEEREAELILFYCQTFWSRAGRAPVLPRRIPPSTA